VPLVSIIIPCYNEQNTITLLLEALLQQTIPIEKLEIIISDGMSTDKTLEVVSRYQAAHSEMEIVLVENKQKTIPSALNRALEIAKGEFIVRMDAHSIPAKDYVNRCITALSSGLGDNVGGVWEIRAGNSTWIARAIALAAAHPLGVGNARYRTQGTKPSENQPAGPADTVPFGSFRKDLLNQIGYFDENLLSNEDYEFNARIRKNGGRIWLDPAIRTGYIARSNLPDLARQYWRYGYWKWRMLRQYLSTARLRQVVPPLFVGSLITLIAMSIWPLWTQTLSFIPIAARWLLIGEIILYSLILFLFALPYAIQKKEISLSIGIPLAIATMHISWGSGFLVSLAKSIFEK
jgi:succinoglycan biosynthesis protein ExoA